MAQEDVLKLLKKEKRWLSTKEIAEKLKIGRAPADSNLNKLYKHGEIFKKEGFVNNYSKLKCLFWKAKWLRLKKNQKK